MPFFDIAYQVCPAAAAAAARRRCNTRVLACSLYNPQAISSVVATALNTAM
jgi:hypothetical protein